MTLKITSAILLAVALFSCSRKSAPQLPERTVATRSVDITTTVKGDPQRGKQVFSNSCNRCHGLPEPGQFTKERYETVLPSMFRKANLQEQEAADVREYVMSNLLKK